MLDPSLYPKAFTKYGIFYPVVMYNGQITGNWKKVTRKGELHAEPVFFEDILPVEKQLIEIAKEKYRKYYLGINREERRLKE